MSIQRAIVNCERCYELTEIELDEEFGPKGDYENIEKRRKRIIKNDQIWNARNEAMKALEDELKVHGGGLYKSGCCLRCMSKV